MRNLKQENGLAFKLILYIFSSISIIFCIIFLYNYFISKNIVEKNLKSNAENITLATVAQVEKVLSTVSKLTDNFAKMIDASDFSNEALIQILKQEVANNKEIYGAALAFEPYGYDKQQKYYAPYFYRTPDSLEFKFLGDKDYDYFTMDWYETPKLLGRPSWSEPYLDEGGGNTLMATYSVPLYKEKEGKRQLIAVLTADISLEWLQQYMTSIRVYETGYGFVLSATGTMVSHPKKELIVNSTVFSIAEAQKSTQLSVIGHNMIEGKSSFAEFEYRNLITGKLSWIAYAPIQLNGWSIGIVFPVEEFMADVNHLFMEILLLAFGGLIIILIVIIYISRTITKPLTSLNRAAGQFAQGDFSVDLPPIKTKDEIGQLSASFLFMQGALAQTINDLKEASEKLRVSNEKLEEYNSTLELKVAERTTELHDKNKELDAAFNHVKTLNEIGKKITSTLNTEDIEKIVYESVNSLLDASSFLIMIYNEKERRLECKLSMEKGEKLPPFVISMEEKNRFAVWCIDNASPMFMNDVANEFKQFVPNRAAPKAGESVQSLIYLPMMIENRVLGVISAQSFRKNAYTQYHFDMLNNLNNYVAIAFENALAYDKINKANNDLKAAQAQLVQAEKMASLGQLTAGIAHEIKNPLNFVNNYAVLTIDLVQELSEELGKLSAQLGEKDREYLLEIAGDISANAQRINDHGKRADSIVKGMLLHSGGKAGDKQPADLNAILAEYVNLGYHGMRAQDNGFNLKIDAEYDNTIGMVQVVPQNISRVFLNIINNACYATNQKKKELGEVYFPILQIRTRNLGEKVEVRIRDNGKGIPQEIIDKIFNPFFTTKPSGQGTGLGLSLSFDIVVQEHQGEMKVESKEGEFAEFVILLPKK